MKCIGIVLKFLSEIEYFCRKYRNFGGTTGKPVVKYIKAEFKKTVYHSCMTGDSVEVIDPSKNPEVLFTQRKKAPGMHCVAFRLDSHCVMLHFWACIVCVIFAFFSQVTQMYNDCSVTCMHNVVELCCMLSAVHDRRLCWHYTLQVLLTHHRSPLQRLEKACCLQKISSIFGNT